MAQNSDFWLISVPVDKSGQHTFERLNLATKGGSDKLSENFKFQIPQLKVGTLDVLVALSDDLNKIDIYTESIVRKLSTSLEDVLEASSKGNLAENLRIRGDIHPQNYLQRFNWDLAKYPDRLSLRAITDIISKDVSHIEHEMKSRINTYNNLKGNLLQLERRTTGSLLTRNIGDLVKKDDFILDSEYLITLVVIVPKTMKDDWLKCYESLTQKVVPRSSRVVFDNDPENLLVTVTLFKQVQDEFKHKCREHKFIVRDFQYSEEEIAAGKDEINKLAADKKKQFGPLVKWLKVNFGEAFTAMVHVKALRVFVESVLRYGLPVNFQAMLVRPAKKNSKRLREMLNQMYGHLDTTALSGTPLKSMEIPGLALSNTEYFAYVFYKINLDFLEPSR